MQPTDPRDAPRDPLRNPKPGDILKDRYGHTVVFRGPNELPPGATFDLKLWRKAMKGATVVRMAK